MVRQLESQPGQVQRKGPDEAEILVGSGVQVGKAGA